MKIRLLFIALLMSTFGTQAADVVTTVKVDPTGGEFVTNGGYTTATLSGTVTAVPTSGVTDISAITYDQQYKMPTAPMRPGYTFAGWGSNFTTAYQGTLYLQDFATGEVLKDANGASIIAPGVYDVAEFDPADPTKLAPFCLDTAKFYGNVAKDRGITVNFWAYMDNWAEYGTSNMRMVSCTQGGGWDMGEKNGENMEFAVYSPIYEKADGTLTTQAGYVHIDFGRPWSALTPGWHMFTFTFRATETNVGYATGYIDAGTTGFVKTVRMGDHIQYNMATPLLVGGEPDAVDGTNKTFTINNRFKGKICYLSFLTQGFKRIEGTGGNAAKIDAMVKKWYDNPGVAYEDLYRNRNDKTSSTRTIEAKWVANPSHKLTVDAADGTAVLEKASQQAGLHAAIDEPTRKDYLFKHWTGDASNYVTLYQDIAGVKEYFTHPLGGTQTDTVIFDGVDDYLHIDDQKYKYKDCFTVHFHAKADWSNIGPVLVSCTEGGGWSIETITESGVKKVGFLCYDTHLKAYRKANTGVAWSDLNNNADKTAGEHSFTYVFTGKHVHAYIDGVLRATSDAILGIDYHLSNSIIIGVESGNDTGVIDDSKGYFKGKMWNFCLLHTALSPSQVAALHNEHRNGTHYYHAAADATLQAVWEPLPLLGVTNQPEELEKEFFLGDPAQELELTIRGNGLKNPVVVATLGMGWQRVSENIPGILKDGDKVRLQYTPPTVEDDKPGTHNAVLTLDEPTYSSRQEVVATYKTYRAVAYTEPTAIKHVWVGDEATENLRITGDGHEKPIVTLDAENGPISIDVSGITADGDGATLRYAPKEVGTYSATLRVDVNSSKKEGNALIKETTLRCHAHQFEVVSWKPNGFNVKLDAGLVHEDVAISFNGEPIVLTANGDDTYFFPVDIRNYSSLAVQPIVFTGTDGDVTWSLPTQVKVDYIAGQAETDATLESHAVIVAKDASLTHSSGELAVQSLYVKADGAFATAGAGKYTANSVFLYSEGDAVPSMDISAGSAFSVKDGTVHFVKCIPGDRWYFFSLPYDCLLADIRFVDGTGSVNPAQMDSKDGIYIQAYDGSERIKNSGNGNGWVGLKDTEKLHAGVGYLVLINTSDPTNLAETKEIVFPMHLQTSGVAALDALENPVTKTVGVIAHGQDELAAGTITANHVGWNLVGNPFLASYGYANDSEAGNVAGVKEGRITMPAAQHGGDMYVTVPIANAYYWQGLYNEIDLAPFSAFFVQTGASGELAFVPAARQEASIMAREANAETAAPIYVGVTLTQGTASDATSLVVGNGFTQAYEIGSDLEKMLGAGNHPQVYIYDDDYRYAFKSLRKEDAAGVNKLGVYLPSDGEYTFAIKDTYDLSPVQALCLTDTEMNKTVDLLQESYTFTGISEENTSRFYLQAIVSEDNTVTDLRSSEGTAWAVWQDGGLQICVRGVRLGDAIRVVDVTGRLVAQAVATEASAIFVLPAAGIYCIQTVGDAGVQAKKISVNH